VNNFTQDGLLSKKLRYSFYSAILEAANTIIFCIEPPGTVSQIWQHNFTFSQSPTPASEAAWDALVPIGRGFITNPQIAPFFSNIAVTHQLHCLHAVLVAHYALETEVHGLRAGNSSTGIETLEGGFSFEKFGTKIDTYHVRHCFDYIRRALMCAADRNLEVVDAKNFTVSGWGQEKVCRDYDGVVNFAEQWRNSSDTGIIT
jgi:hypothetical protein